MPRFFFNLYDDLEVLDPDGVELPDLEAARACGLKNARAIAADQVLRGKLDLRHRIEIADEFGQVLRTIPFADAIAIAS